MVGFGDYPKPKNSLQSGVLYAPKGSVMIKHFLSEMERIPDYGISNYIYSAWRNGIAYNSIVFSDYPSIRTYFVVAVALQITLDRLCPRNLTLLFLNTKTTMYRLQFDCEWNNECIAAKIQNSTEMKHYSLTKLNGVNRRYMETSPPPAEIEDCKPLRIVPESHQYNRWYSDLLLLWTMIELMIVLVCPLHVKISILSVSDTISPTSKKGR